MCQALTRLSTACVTVHTRFWLLCLYFCSERLRDSHLTLHVATFLTLYSPPHGSLFVCATFTVDCFKWLHLKQNFKNKILCSVLSNQHRAISFHSLPLDFFWILSVQVSHTGGGHTTEGPLEADLCETVFSLLLLLLCPSIIQWHNWDLSRTLYWGILMMPHPTECKSDEKQLCLLRVYKSTLFFGIYSKLHCTVHADSWHVK